MTLTPRHTRALRVARAIHRVALRLTPRRVREGHRAEMVATFAAMADQASWRGSAAVARLLAREVWDLAIAGLRSRAFWSRADRAPHQLPVDLPPRSHSMIAMWRDLLNLRHLRQAGRALGRRPAFASAAFLTLAVGTGAVTSLFGVVDTILIKPLPYPHADRLVTVYEASSSRREKTSLIAPVRLQDWNQLNQTFEAIAGSYAENVTDTSGLEPERLEGRRVTPRYFAVYGVDPIAGRTFTAEEERFGGPGAAVISEGFWRRRFHGDPTAVGRRLTIGGAGFTVVGVLPHTFTSTTTDVWLPAQTPPWLLQVRDARFLAGVGRMKAGVTIEQASGDLARVQRALGDQFPRTDKDWSVVLDDLKHARVGGQASTLWLIFGAVALLWLIGVTNMAGLMLVQMHRRAREMAIRAAIGASRPQVVGAVMREVILLAAAGTVAGAGLAVALIRVVRTEFTTLPRLNELAIDWRALAFAAITTGVAALLFGLWPALHATRGRLAPAIAQGGRGASTGRHRMQQVLVAAEVALSVLLVGSAALLVRSYYNLSHATTGFNTDDVLTFHMGARWDEDRDRVGQLQERLVAALAGLPGVEAAGLTNFLPKPTATLRYQVTVEGLAGPEQGGTMTIGERTISSGYLRALRVPLLSGAWCPDLRHDFKAPGSVLVNRRFLDDFAGNQDLVGRRLTFVQGGNSTHTIAGVVGDVIEDGPGASPMPYVYSCVSAGSWPDPEYVVRTRDAAGTAIAIRQLVHALDPGRAVFGVRPVADLMSDSLDQPRLNAGLLGVFAAAALALAAVGLYSLFMLLVGERAREIGVRLALGAAPGQMTRLVFAGAGRLLAAGLGIGLALSVATERVIGALLFNVAPLDPLTLGVTTLLLATVSALAIALPALRAGQIDPILALKGD